MTSRACAREAAASRRRADGRERRTDARLPGGATLRFTSRPTWSAGLVVVGERYELLGRDGTRSVHEYVFEMRPWGRGAIEERLRAGGFVDVQVLPGVGRRTPDRLFVAGVRAAN